MGELKIIIFVIDVTQGRIYVANEYPTFARTMSMVGQKLTVGIKFTNAANFREKNTNS